jgi:aminoglycoside 6-adenylyltransferase
LIERITQWASHVPEVRAALILGSRARSDHPADAWSDLDVLVFAFQHDQFIQSAEWVKAIAPYWLTLSERTGDGKAWERRTLFQGGLDVDVAFYPAELMDDLLRHIPSDVADIIRRGIKILVDKDGQLARLQHIPLPSTTLFQKPSEHEFINAVSDFWYHTLWSVRHLRRGELWWAKSGVDGHLKGLLQQMLEWHARASKGEKFDTWLRGRFLEEWADARAVEQLNAVFAHYHRHDIARALQATMKLYRWLEDETAECWGYARPLEGEKQAATLTLQLLAEMD